MVKKAYLKSFGRMFKKHIARFFSLIFIILISVGFISGIGSSTDMISNSLTEFYKSSATGDFIIKSRSADGFTQGDVEAVKRLFEGAEVNTGVSLDIKVADKRSLRLYFLDFANWNVNVPEIIEGERAADKNECYSEQSDNVIEGMAAGESFVLDFNEIFASLGEHSDEESEFFKNLQSNLKPVTVKVCAVVSSPLVFAKEGEPSYNNENNAAVENNMWGTKDLDCLNNILYLSKELIPEYKDLFPFVSEETNAPLLSESDIYVCIGNRELFNAFSSAYKSYVDEYKIKINEILPDAEILTLYDNYSFASLVAYRDKIAGIGYVVMAAFLLVTALVVFSTMARLIDEERTQAGCLKTLGYTSFEIVSRYVFFALIATGIGCFLGYFVGLGIGRLVYAVFDFSFAMPPLSADIPIIFYVITCAVIVLGTLFATTVSGMHILGEMPANLLSVKPPKSGKKTLLEKIPFIWNKLSFKYKSTCRNILRYKGRFLMTVIAVAFSTALVLTGLAVLDLCFVFDFGSVQIMGIAIITIICAGLLTGVVIYTLTNINISERNREIATLMVLGYHDLEVTGYIYREIYVNSVIGIIFGYPASLIFMQLIFSIIGVGTIGKVSFYVWLAAPFAVLLFTFIVNLILRGRILKINMNESLKSTE